MRQPPRVAWRAFPDAVLLATESRTKRHPEYAAAKSGDAAAALRLVDALVEEPGVATVRRMIDAASGVGVPVLVSAHAYEGEGVNAIPMALARLLARRLRVDCEEEVVQINVVSHTGADGYGRLARQAALTGEVAEAGDCVLVDDFIGQGGTLANLQGWIETRGGMAVGAVGSRVMPSRREPRHADSMADGEGGLLTGRRMP